MPTLLSAVAKMRSICQTPLIAKESVLCSQARARTRGGERTRLGAGAVAMPPNPFGAPFTAPEHPFLEVSLSPPPISLLPESGSSGLAARVGRSLSVCHSLDP